MRAPDHLQQQAKEISGQLPDLVLQAERLAALIAPGAYGLHRAGQGEDFWQYRPSAIGDSASSIDWRRSARSDAQYVREREVQTAQSVGLWVSAAQGMTYSGAPDRSTKLSRSRLLALAMAMVLLRGGERVGLFAQTSGIGKAQLDRIAQALVENDLVTTQEEIPPAPSLRPNQRLILISDFLSDPAWIAEFLGSSASMGVRGILLQVLDPDEEHFPFVGAVDFKAMSGRFNHLTRDAAGLQTAYRQRFAERRAWLEAQSAASGWRFGHHRTDQPAITGLARLYQMLEL